MRNERKKAQQLKLLGLNFTLSTGGEINETKSLFCLTSTYIMHNKNTHIHRA